MTIGKIRSKMRKMREDFEDEEMENGELNLVPYLDIVTNVIMFLMMTTTFAAALADINVSAPTTASAGAAAQNPEQQPKQDLNLTVSISDKGVTIACSGGLIFEGCQISPAGDFVNCAPGNKLPSIPKVKGEHDYPALTKKMREIKAIAIAADETKVIVNANPEITYETVVAVMDAIRADGTKTLFPDVLLAAGVQ